MRYLAKSSGVPGDYPGQTSMGMRMPYGGVSVITPFNFPLEIYGVKSREGGMLATAARSFSCARRPT